MLIATCVAQPFLLTNTIGPRWWGVSPIRCAYSTFSFATSKQLTLRRALVIDKMFASPIHPSHRLWLVCANLVSSALRSRSKGTLIYQAVSHDRHDTDAGFPSSAYIAIYCFFQTPPTIHTQSVPAVRPVQGLMIAVVCVLFNFINVEG
jgi:hypothetical protein